MELDNPVRDEAKRIKESPRREKIDSTNVCKKHQVFNVVETIANEKVLDVMSRMDLCTCEQCICDVLALALNSLPPKYVTSHAGKQYIQLEAYKKQLETDVAFALMKACMTVKDTPNHEE
ncbi:MAG: Late competence development protein ComFB [Bacillota bacterium]|jgi:competence protein ComFB|nr:Late competence development protein ComFB [Bacillota bacterium]